MPVGVMLVGGSTTVDLGDVTRISVFVPFRSLLLRRESGIAWQYAD